MRPLIIACLLVLLAAVSARAQTLSTTTCPGAGCAQILTNNNGSVGVQISGTFVGTLTFEQTIDGVTWFSWSVSVPGSTTSVTTATTTGLYVGNTTGVRVVRVRFSAYTSGSAVLSTAQSQARSLFGVPTVGGDGTVPTGVAAGSVLASNGVGAQGVWSATPTITSLTVADSAYGAGWNGSLLVPTRNAVYDKIETLVSSPGGSNTEVQYNNAGAMAGASGLTYNITTTRYSGRFAPRVTTAADATTITPTSDATDITYQLNTQGAGTLTIANPTGTPVDGQTLIIRIKSTNSHTLSWGANYRGSTTLTLTTTNTAAKTDYFMFRWHAVDSKWDFLAENLGF